MRILCSLPGFSFEALIGIVIDIVLNSVKTSRTSRTLGLLRVNHEDVSVVLSTDVDLTEIMIILNQALSLEIKVALQLKESPVASKCVKTLISRVCYKFCFFEESLFLT